MWYRCPAKLQILLCRLLSPKQLCLHCPEPAKAVLKSGIQVTASQEEHACVDTGQYLGYCMDCKPAAAPAEAVSCHGTNILFTLSLWPCT